VRVEAYRAETREMDAVVTIGEEALHLVSTEDGAEADVLELREALEILQGENPLAAQIVRLRFFAQATHSEIAADLGIPEIRSRRTWTLARRRLNQLLGRSSHEA
jgi:DNA-directed RNA polymerase specialized sigma24 family protein